MFGNKLPSSGSVTQGPAPLGAPNIPGSMAGMLVLIGSVGKSVHLPVQAVGMTPVPAVPVDRPAPDVSPVPALPVELPFSLTPAQPSAPSRPVSATTPITEE